MGETDAELTLENIKEEKKFTSQQLELDDGTLVDSDRLDKASILIMEQKLLISGEDQKNLSQQQIKETLTEVIKALEIFAQNPNNPSHFYNILLDSVSDITGIGGQPLSELIKALAREKVIDFEFKGSKQTEVRYEYHSLPSSQS